MSSDAQLLTAAVALIGIATMMLRDLYSRLARCETRHEDCERRMLVLEQKAKG